MAGEAEQNSGAVTDPELERLLILEDERMGELISKAFAPNTRRNYAADWESFSSWCTDRGFTSLPAKPEAVARYLLWLIDRPPTVVIDTVSRDDRTSMTRSRVRKQLKPATLRRDLVSIGVAHRSADCADPTTSQMVRDLARGIEVERGSAGTKKARLDYNILRVAFASRSWHSLIDQRDRAMVLFAWNSGFRRSEIAALDSEHIRRNRDGIEVDQGLLRARRARANHQVRMTYDVESPLCAVTALDAWLGVTGITSGPVFRRVDRHGNLGGRISGEVVAAVAKKLARLAGLDERDFAAHSFRMRAGTSRDEL